MPRIGKIGRQGGLRQVDVLKLTHVGILYEIAELRALSMPYFFTGLTGQRSRHTPHTSGENNPPWDSLLVGRCGP